MTWHDGPRRGRCYNGAARLGQDGYINVSSCEESMGWHMATPWPRPPSKAFKGVTKTTSPYASSWPTRPAAAAAAAAPVARHRFVDVVSPVGPPLEPPPICTICAIPFYEDTQDGRDHRAARICTSNHVICADCAQNVLKTNGVCPFCRQPLLHDMDLFVAPEVLSGNLAGMGLRYSGGARSTRRPQRKTPKSARRNTSRRRKTPRSMLRRKPQQTRAKKQRRRP